MLDDFYDMPINERWLILWFVGLGVGLIFGIWMHRISLRREPVQGGFPALLFHYLAGSAITALIPFIIIGLIGGLNFVRLVLAGLGFSALSWVFLILYATFERTETPQ